MKKYNIAVIAGDGIGPEVIGEAVKVLKAICASDDRFDMCFTEFPWGCEYYLKNGEMMPENGLELLSKYDAILLGAVGYPGVPDHISLRNLLLKIRHGKDQPNEVVIQNSVFSRKGCERVIRYAYELARKEGRSLTSVSKANALNYSMVFWDQIFEEVGREYPDVETRHLLVDAASMFMVRDPKRFGVVVTSNLFGDILTDLGAAISGGMGLAAGANLNPERRYPSMFEAIHGSAPDIAGQNIANPLASIWTAGQMLDFFGYEDWGTKIVDSIEQMLVSKKALTPDLGGSASTTECGDEMVRILTQ